MGLKSKKSETTYEKRSLKSDQNGIEIQMCILGEGLSLLLKSDQNGIEITLSVDVI